MVNLIENVQGFTESGKNFLVNKTNRLRNISRLFNCARTEIPGTVGPFTKNVHVSISSNHAGL